MKRYFLLVTIVAISTLCARVAPATLLFSGDLDKNADINVGDLIGLTNILNGGETLMGLEKALADANQDGTISTDDPVFLVDVILGRVDGLPLIEMSATAAVSYWFQEAPPATESPSIVSIPPDQQPSITIVSIAGLNVPDGAVIKLRLTLEDGSTLAVDSSPVSGNSASASVDLPVGTGVLYATASFN